jgi:NTP pyrophosphatase (non-canonical NTP hydrolase)
MSDSLKDDLNDLRARLRQFSAERDWKQFHTPKNLAAALSVEAAELLEPFQWLVNGEKDELGEAKLKEVRFEMADVLAYLIQLADRLDVDLYQALIEKIELNRIKYPAELSRGDPRKYSEY